jgi:hypothetical protein
MIDKTGVKNTAALVQYAFRAGLINWSASPLERLGSDMSFF